MDRGHPDPISIPDTRAPHPTQDCRFVPTRDAAPRYGTSGEASTAFQEHLNALGQRTTGDRLRSPATTSPLLLHRFEKALYRPARFAPVIATLVLGLVWALWHLPLVFVDPRFPHGFTSIAPLGLLALLTLVGISLMAFFYTWIYNATQSVLLCMLLHGSFNTATSFVLAPFQW